MEARTLNCPNCGAAASTKSSRCAHCNSKLATVACPSCFGMIFLGAKFCSHCGARADRQEFSDKTVRLCPHCQVNTRVVLIGESRLRECSRCEGLWADADSLQKICTDRERQAAVLGVAKDLSEPAAKKLAPVRYVPCPVCKKLMNRVNFARCSNVVVDVCRAHGTWFDKDELRRIVEFIRNGGFEESRRKEIEELERKRRQLETARATNARESAPVYGGYHHDWIDCAVSSAAASVIDLLFN